ncbi:transcriptional regulator family protein, partial [Staphylococcus epidermidis]
MKHKKPQKHKNTTTIYPKFAKQIYLPPNSPHPNPHSNQTLTLLLQPPKTYSLPNHIIHTPIHNPKPPPHQNYHHLTYQPFRPNRSILIL